MPVEFLSCEQKKQYRNFNSAPSQEQLATYFLLDDQDKIAIFKCRGKHNQLGFAIQLTTVRFLGSFLSSPVNVPEIVINYVSYQLGIASENIDSYKGSRSIWSHTQEICRIYQYHNFSEQPYHWRFIRWLYNRFWYTNDSPSTLFDLAISRCLDLKVLLPGITVLERLISEVKESATERLWCKLSSLPDANQIIKLEKLLLIESKKYTTGLEIIRQQITHESPIGFLKAIERFNKIYSLGAHKWNISRLPIGKIKVLSRHAAVARAQTIERMPYERRIATLVAFTIIFTTSSQDNIIDYMIKYFTELFNKADRNSKKERLRTLKDLDSSARELSEACKFVLDENIKDNEIRKKILEIIAKERLQAAVETVDILTRPVEQTIEFKEIFKHFSSVRKFLPKLLSSIEFKASAAGKQALLSWKFLAANENKTGKNKYAGAPTEGMSASWKKVMSKGDRIKPCPYTFWVIEKMLEGIKNFDIYLENSDKYRDPRSNLIQPEEWENTKNKIINTLGWSINAKESLSPLKEKLDTAFVNTVQNWDTNPDVRVEIINNKSKIILTNIDKLEEPKSSILLKKQVNSLIPEIDLTGILLEISAITKFTDQFTHISLGNSRITDLPISICAVLIAKACNIGLKPVVQRGIPALEYDRLTWVEQNYFRSETIALANDALVEFYSRLNIPKSWGSGNIASADGVRHLTPSKTIYAGSSPPYFGFGRGITSLELISDMLIGLNIKVLTGTLRDSIGLLELVLGQNTIIKPNEIMTDTAGYSDIIFGLFALLGYQFSPRIADMGDSKLWRFDSNVDYGILDALSKNKLHEDLIIKYWDDMLRIAGSLKVGTINPTNLIRMLQRSGKPTMLGRSIGEFGKIFKTLHHLCVMDDKNYRRSILKQLNMGESEHGLKRAVLYGKKGELYQPTREGQEDQLNTLGLVTNCIIVWNTIYIESALNAMQIGGYPVNPADLKWMTPFGYDHINILGRYLFELTESILNGELRPLLPMDKKLFGII